MARVTYHFGKDVELALRFCNVDYRTIDPGTVLMNRTSAVRAHPHYSEEDAYELMLMIIQEQLDNIPGRQRLRAAWSSRCDEYLGIEVWMLDPRV